MKLVKKNKKNEINLETARSGISVSLSKSKPQVFNRNYAFGSRNSIRDNEFEIREDITFKSTFPDSDFDTGSVQ